jgi:hypothetical protein
MDLFAGDRWFPGRDCQEDTEPECDDHARDEPACGDLLQHPARPQGDQGSDEQHEITDQVEVDESHEGGWDQPQGPP